MDGCQQGEQPAAIGSSLEVMLPAALQLIVRDGPAATVAACLLLKAIFLALHLLALRLPECSGLERLALLHWSFDAWNVWCLAVFARTGRLPWSLETCVVYHVFGYLVYSLVYLHLHTREWTARGGDVPRMAATPDSEMTVRVSDAEEEEEEMAAAAATAGGEPFAAASGRPGVLSEDVPDEEPAAEDRDAAGAGGRDSLCAIPEDSVAPDTADSAPPPDTVPSADGETQSPAETPADDSPGTEGPAGRPYRKLDAAGDLLPQQTSPAVATDDGRCPDITEDTAASLKADKQGQREAASSGQPRDTDATGFNKYSPVKADRGRNTDPYMNVSKVTVTLDGGQERRGDGDHVEEQGGAEEDKEGVKIQNGDHSGALNGDHKGALNGDHNGALNGAEMPQNGDQRSGDQGKQEGCLECADGRTG